MYSSNWHNPLNRWIPKKKNGRDRLATDIYKSTSDMSHVATKTTHTSAIYWTCMNMGKFHSCLCLRAGIVPKKTPPDTCARRTSICLDKFNLSLFVVNPSWDYQPFILIVRFLQTSSKQVKLMIGRYWLEDVSFFLGWHLFRFSGAR